MSYFLINDRTPEAIRTALSRFGTCVPLPPYEALPFPVSHHPDMLTASIRGTLFIHRGYHEGRKILDRLHIPYCLSEKEIGSSYPEDVALNCFAAGNFLFGKKAAISPEVLRHAQEAGLRFVPVKQGYAKCSAVVAGGAVASADTGIVSAAEDCGIPALLLPPRHIAIERYNTGFLGGASCLIDEHTLGFFGRIEDYPEYEALRAFFSTRNVEILSLSEEPLFDLGGAMTVISSAPLRTAFISPKTRIMPDFINEN